MRRICHNQSASRFIVSLPLLNGLLHYKLIFLFRFTDDAFLQVTHKSIAIQAGNNNLKDWSVAMPNI